MPEEIDSSPGYKGIFIVDNGGYSMKTGWSSDEGPKSIPNCIAKVKSERRRPFIGDQLEECKDYSGLFYILPIQKGYIVNWETQKTVWNYLFKTRYDISEGDSFPSGRSLLMTEPYFNFRSCQENLMENLFEEYGFKNLFLTNPASLTAYKYCKEHPSRANTCLVVDAGYSFTHIIPYVNGKQVKEGIRRIDVGGKALTNHLKDIISYRQLHVLDETYVMNQCKEDCCFVSQNFLKQLDSCRGRTSSSLFCDYVLPDYTVVKRGFIRKPGVHTTIDQQMIRMNNERICIPELLFFPTDCGINQIGISHSIYHSIECLPEEVKPHLYSNIVLMGGSASFPGFRDRIQSDVRSLANVLYDVNVSVSDSPSIEAWFGAKLMSQDESALKAICVDRKLYREAGPSVCIEKLEENKTAILSTSK